MKQRFWFVALSLIGVVAVSLLGGIQQALAAAPYHGNWPEQPTWGNHWWWNNPAKFLEWDSDDLWSQAHVDAMRNWHNNFPWNEYRIEQEAYDPSNPGNQSSCDRLAFRNANWINLPVTGHAALNGCGDGRFLEELHIELDENAIQPNVWYQHRVTYDERKWCRVRFGGGEVNYSFSHNHAVPPGADSWMGKITYDKCFNRLGSDPNGMVN